MHEAYNLKSLKDIECMKHKFKIPEGYKMPEAYILPSNKNSYMV